MRILEVIETLAPGGGQRFVVDLCNELSKSEEVGVLTFRSTKKSDFYRKELNPVINQFIYHGSYRLLSRLIQILIVFKCIVKYKPDVVHVHILAFTYALIPSLILKKTKFYYTVHNVADKDTSPGLSTFMRRLFLKDRIRAITISEYCNRTFKYYYGYSSFGMIENGCREIKTTACLNVVRNEINSLKTSIETKVFVNVARIMEQKNHELLIAAFNVLIKKNIDAVLLIIGDFNNDIERKKKLDLLIDNNRIVFLGVKDNVADYLALSDYFCLTSAWEGLPISLLEAGLSGCYPVCTAVGGVPNVIENENFGVLSDDLSVESFVKAMEKAMSLNIDRYAIKECYHQRYLMSMCAKKYMNTFNL